MNCVNWYQLCKIYFLQNYSITLKTNTHICLKKMKHIQMKIYESGLTKYLNGKKKNKSNNV